MRTTGETAALVRVRKQLTLPPPPTRRCARSAMKPAAMSGPAKSSIGRDSAKVKGESLATSPNIRPMRIRCRAHGPASTVCPFSAWKSSPPGQSSVDPATPGPLFICCVVTLAIIHAEVVARRACFCFVQDTKSADESSRSSLLRIEPKHHANRHRAKRHVVDHRCWPLKLETH